jgi:hypothetical protein
MIAAAAIAVVASAVLAAWLAPRWSTGTGGTFAPRRLVVNTRVEPASALFGDILTARANVLVDTRDIDAGSVQVYGRFAPYRIVSTSRSVTDDVGHAARVSFAFRLQCVVAACLDAMEQEGRDGRVVTTPIAFRSAELVAVGRDGARRDVQVSWTPVVVRSRLSPDDLTSGEPRLPAFTAPVTSFRISPDLLGWALVIAAVVLLLLGGWLVGSTLRGRPVARRLRIPSHLSPIDRALALARYAASTGDTAGERRALERLAAELRRSGDGDLAVAARRLAWSAREPTDDRLEELAAGVARTNHGR